MRELLKKNYEKLLLAAALIVLVVTAIILYVRAGKIAEQIRNPTAITGPISVELIDKRRYDRNFQQITSPFQWRPSEHRLFAPDLFYKTTDRTLAIWRDPDKNNNAIDDKWEIRFGLPIHSETQQHADEDYDNDGFLNREEYLAGTDPLDPASRPSYAFKLAVAKLVDQSTTIRCTALIRDTQDRPLAMLQLIETSGQSTRNVYKGDTLGYHKVIDFVMNPQTQSLKAVILKAELPGHDPQTLESGKEIVFTDRSVSFHNKVDNTTTPMMRVGDHYEFRDEKFSLKAIDTANRKVIIQDAAGKEYTLPMPK